MSPPLWTLTEIITATLSSPRRGEGARRADEGLATTSTLAVASSPSPALQASSPVPGEESVTITGVSIDTRTLAPGDLFVALKDVRDGHDFVSSAFEKGAAAALVKRDFDPGNTDPRLLRVDYSTEGIPPDEAPLEALRRLARAARARLSPDARVIAVTGSAGKTTTKEMLRACLTPLGATHASEKSYNNHWGVPLTLARMPASTKYAILEIGMNHVGEITPLTKLARPHIAIITTVAAVHLEHFASVEDIARAKAEIFLGLEPGGTAVIPRDNTYFDLLKSEGEAAGAKCITFGDLPNADVSLTNWKSFVGCNEITATFGGQLFHYRLAMRGFHNTMNSLAAFAALAAAGCEPSKAITPLAGFYAPPGRGSLHPLSVGAGTALVIDESYNANPLSMRAAIDVAFEVQTSRLVLVLGDMLELGRDAPRFHANLATPIATAAQTASNVLVLTCGPLMHHLHTALPENIRGPHAESSAALAPHLLALVQPGDVIMIKGSNGSKMNLLVQALLNHFPPKSANIS